MLNRQTYAQMLKRPEVTIEALVPVLRERLAAEAEKLGDSGDHFAGMLEGMRAQVLPVQVRNEIKTVETEIKYAGYLDQQRKSMDKLKRAEEHAIPEWFDYTTVSGLSREMQEKLGRVRPATLGQASRMQGVTPAAVSLIHVYIQIQGRLYRSAQPRG